MRGFLKLAAILLGLQLLGPLPAAAHEGHDHGAPPPPATTSVAPRMEASSGDFELVAVSGRDEIVIYIDRFRSNEPVPGAEIDIDAGGQTLKAEAVAEGVYRIKPDWVGTPGGHDLAITIQADGIIDILTGTLVIPAPAEPKAGGQRLGGFMPQLIGGPAGGSALWLVAGLSFVLGIAVAIFFRRRAFAAALAVVATGALLMESPASAASTTQGGEQAVMRDMAQRLPDGTIFVPKATQHLLAIRTLFTAEENHPGTVELPARIIPDPNSSGYVQSSVGGRLMPPDGGFPRLGTRVEAGQVLGHVLPVIGAADLNSQQTQLREVEQEISLIERKLSRYAKLKDVVSAAAVEDAELELVGLQARKKVLGNAAAAAEDLAAPVSGVIASVNAVAGQIAEPSAIIFHIVDPSRYWVEALSYEALAITGEGEGRLADGRVLNVSYRGTGLSDRNQAVPVHFEIQSGAENIRAGQLLTVLAQTGEGRKGIAVPRTSVIRGTNGQSIVYEHISAENFRPREVVTEPLDGQRVLILSSIAPGRRVVSQGAELLNQIR